MSITLEEHFQQNLSRQIQLSKRISPVLKLIKENHINSLFQFEMKTKKQTILQDSKNQTNTFSKIAKISEKNKFQNQINNVFDKTYRTISFKKNTYNNDHSNKKSTKKIFNKTFMNFRSLDTAQKYESFEPIDREIIYRKIMTNPNSKIKRHLVHSIDFDQIEKALFRKPKVINKFDQFCFDMKYKDQQRKYSTEKKKVRSKKMNSFRLIENQEANQINQFHQKGEICSQENSFRITAKKKFWKKQFQNMSQRMVNKVNQERFQVESFKVILQDKKESRRKSIKKKEIVENA